MQCGSCKISSGVSAFLGKEGLFCHVLKIESFFLFYYFGGGGANPYFHNPSGVVNIPSGGLTGRNGGVHGRLIFLVGGFTVLVGGFNPPTPPTTAILP